MKNNSRALHNKSGGSWVIYKKDVSHDMSSSQLAHKARYCSDSPLSMSRTYFHQLDIVTSAIERLTLGVDGCNTILIG